jgi:hypothetical protein
MEDKQLTENESLLLIQQMIDTAKHEQKDDGKGWIIWGWLIFLSSIFTFFNMQYNWASTFFFWNLFGLFSLLILLYQVIRYLFIKKRIRVKTYTQDLFDKLNTGFFISLMLIILSMNLGHPNFGVPPQKGFALLLGLYGFWILIYGAVLNFKPSIIGAYVVWAFAFASLFVTSFQWTMLLHAAAVLCGYIIPGHIANAEFNKLHKEARTQRV